MFLAYLCTRTISYGVLKRSFSMTQQPFGSHLVKSPPVEVKGMTVWEPEKFNKKISVPYVELHRHFIGLFKKLMGDLVLKMPNLAHVRLGENEDTRKLLLDPDAVQSFEDLPKAQVERLRSNEIDFDANIFNFLETDLKLNNWRTHELLDAVLLDPERGIPSLKSYSIIGHIAHLNLKDHHTPFKKVIGEIILNTTSRIKTVVNKVDTIDNTFRNFAMEVLAGVASKDIFKVTVKENGCQFQFDFSKVYWNPRLSSEHERLVKMLCKGDVLFDVFAGVGPFAVPAAKLGIYVYANDLNPESFKWLQENVKLNKLDESKIKCFNQDGREFIRTVFKEFVSSKERSWSESQQIHVAMNLPALATEFLDAFSDLAVTKERNPVIHVYSFTKDMENAESDLRLKCERSLGRDLGNDVDFSFVRNVAPNKEMYRVSFKLPRSKSKNDGPELKKQRID